MAASSLPTSLFLGSLANRKTSPILSPSIKIKPTKVTKPTFAIRCSWKDDHDFEEGGLVDKNMAVLRMRIQELKEQETNWEKQCRTAGYCTLTSAAVGVLQVLLMYAKPNLTVVFIVLLAIGVSASQYLFVVNFMETFDRVM